MTFDEQFGQRLARDYGSYCVLWPCRLYELGQGKAFEQFRSIGPQKPTGWRYFPLARAHQALLAGNRAAGYQTLKLHLDHPQMKGWYAFDEGGKSGSGGWGHARTTWNASVAMPHGWAIAELHLLLRDCLAFENGGRLVLLGGIDPAWLSQSIHIEKLPTWFGPLTLRWTPATDDPRTVELKLEGADPPEGFVLRLGTKAKAEALPGGTELSAGPDGDVALPRGTTRASVILSR